MLQNENSASLMQFAVMGSHEQRIAGVIEKLNRDFAQPLRVENLAAEARMSASSLWDYFKEVTGMSPIQLQRQIRLQVARRLLFSGSIDAAEAAFQVGYESPTHFKQRICTDVWDAADPGRTLIAELYGLAKSGSEISRVEKI